MGNGETKARKKTAGRDKTGKRKEASQGQLQKRDGSWGKKEEPRKEEKKASKR